MYYAAIYKVIKSYCKLLTLYAQESLNFDDLHQPQLSLQFSSINNFDLPSHSPSSNHWWQEICRSEHSINTYFLRNGWILTFGWVVRWCAEVTRSCAINFHVRSILEKIILWPHPMTYNAYFIALAFTFNLLL